MTNVEGCKNDGDMMNRKQLSDIQPTKQPIRLIYCSNCGQKQDRFNQKYCSNCGNPFQTEKHLSLTEKSEKPEHDGNNIYSSDLNNIGGWLILPYIGFYITALISLGYVCIYVLSSNSRASKNSMLFIAYLFMLILSIACIDTLHKRKKSFLNYVTALYAIGIGQIMYMSYETRSVATFIGGVFGYGIWLAYFTESKRVKVLLGSKD